MMMLAWLFPFRSRIRPVLLGALAVALSVVVTHLPADAQPASPERPLTVVAFGDMPYRTVDLAPFEALLASISTVAPDITIHVGDIKGGGTPCSDETIQRQRDYMDSIAGPVVYTPGDNEWTDCFKRSLGSYDPLERLAFLRAEFFSVPASLGASVIPVVRQADVDPDHAIYVENLRWEQGGVRFVTAHVVGSNNNLDSSRPDALAEYRARNAANVDWIVNSFQLAAKEGATAVVLAMQADPFLLLGLGGGFRDTLAAIAEGAKAFAGPVLVIHGDGHQYTLDTPFHDAMGNLLTNVFRVEVPGAADIRAVRIMIDPAAANIFTFEAFGPGRS